MMKPLVLVMEEFEILRAQLDEMLTHAGYRVRLAKTLAEGVARAQREEYEVVLLDVAFSQDGSVQSFQTTTPVLLTATKSQREKANRLLQDYAIDCISKPFNKAEVLNKIARVVSLGERGTKTNPNTEEPRVTVVEESTDRQETEQSGEPLRRADIAHLHLSIERASEARSVYLKCLAQQERNNRIACDEHYRVLEHARADLEIQLNEYIDARIKLASLANLGTMRDDRSEDRTSLEKEFWTAHLLSRPALDLPQGIDCEQEVTRYEIDLIKRALEVTGGHQSRAARLLRMNPTTLNSKVKKYRIKV